MGAGESGGLLFIVPAYNEAKNLPFVIEELLTVVRPDQILVVNDGSRDDTALVGKRYPIGWIDFPINLGVAGVLQAGFRYAMRKGFQRAVQFDGDGQHIATEAVRLQAALDGGEWDIVIGVRNRSEGWNSSFARRVGNLTLSTFLHLITGRRFSDPTSGFRAYSPEAIRAFAAQFPEEYPEVEALVLATKLGLRIGEVPVSMRNRMSGHSSITLPGSVYYMVKVFLASFIAILRRY